MNVSDPERHPATIEIDILQGNIGIPNAGRAGQFPRAS
jgi:hypothetical protein